MIGDQHIFTSEEPVLCFCRTLNVIFRLVCLNHNKGMIEQFYGETSKCKGFESKFRFMRQPDTFLAPGEQSDFAKI